MWESGQSGSRAAFRKGASQAEECRFPVLPVPLRESVDGTNCLLSFSGTSAAGTSSADGIEVRRGLNQDTWRDVLKLVHDGARSLVSKLHYLNCRVNTKICEMSNLFWMGAVDLHQVRC